MPWVWMSEARQVDWLWLVKTLTRIDTKLTAFTKHMEIEMTAMEDAVTALSTQVSANTDAENSAITLIKNLADLIVANAGDPAAINDLAVRLKASADALGAAVVANTPTNT